MYTVVIKKKIFKVYDFLSIVIISLTKLPSLLLSIVYSAMLPALIKLCQWPFQGSLGKVLPNKLQCYFQKGSYPRSSEGSAIAAPGDTENNRMFLSKQAVYTRLT